MWPAPVITIPLQSPGGETDLLETASNPNLAVERAASGSDDPPGVCQQLAELSDIGDCQIRLMKQAGGL